MSDMWLRLDGEPEAAWKAFQHYRDQYRRPRVFHASGAKAPVYQVWNKEWRWVERAAAYDAHMEAVTMAQREAVLESRVGDVSSELLGLLSDAREVLAREVGRWAELARSESSTPIMKPNELSKFGDFTMKYTQLLLGNPTDRTETTIDMAKLSPEEQRALLDSLRKANKGE